MLLVHPNIISPPEHDKYISQKVRHHRRLTGSCSLTASTTQKEKIRLQQEQHSQDVVARMWQDPTYPLKEKGKLLGSNARRRTCQDPAYYLEDKGKLLASNSRRTRCLLHTLRRLLSFNMLSQQKFRKLHRSDSATGRANAPTANTARTGHRAGPLPSTTMTQSFVSSLSGLTSTSASYLLVRAEIQTSTHGLRRL